MDLEKYSNFKVFRESNSRRAQRMLKKTIKETYVQTIELAKGIAEVSSIFTNEDSCLNDLGFIRKIAKAYRDYNEIEFRHNRKPHITSRAISNVNISNVEKLCYQQFDKNKLSISSISEARKLSNKKKIESKRILAITPGPGIGDKLKKIKEDFISNNFKDKNYSFLKKRDVTRHKSLNHKEKKKMGWVPNVRI